MAGGTHTRKSAQKKKKSATQNSQKIKFQKKSRPMSATQKKNQDSNCQQAKARRYVVFYKEGGYMSLIGPSKISVYEKKKVGRLSAHSKNK